MFCENFGKCGSCTLYDLNYDEQKKFKIEYMHQLFDSFEVEKFEWRSSKQSHYRSRAEFMIYHDGDSIAYAMHALDEKRKLPISSCPKTDEKIYDLMPKLLIYIKKSEVLRRMLFGIEFLSSHDKILAVLLYHKKLDESWRGAAGECASILGVKLTGRSKN
ncbi:MAG: tRNA (uridine(54)-C5)-methyltransferase TrmA, partial [Campylobacteraceae bacterium]|nr:tRNA (uridine(54)-C5)-methyltransferase TrmA [Campylobacteraceae bacterium]